MTKVMTKDSGTSQSHKQEVADVIEQMNSWMQHKTRLTLLISTPLFFLFLRGRIVGRQGRLFLFDNYGKTCRVPVIPENYDRVVCKQKGLAKVTFETSEIQGRLEMCEDGAEPMFGEMCADWVLSNMVGDATSSGSAERVLR